MMEPKDMENNELRTNSHKLELREVAYTTVQQASLAHVSVGFQIFCEPVSAVYISFFTS